MLDLRMASGRQNRAGFAHGIFVFLDMKNCKSDWND